MVSAHYVQYAYTVLETSQLRSTFVIYEAPAHLASRVSSRTQIIHLG